MEKQTMYTTKKSTLLDVDQIVQIHHDTFENFFLTSLGADFLKFYYYSLIKNHETVCFVAVDNDKIVGFSVATVMSKGFNTRLIRSNLYSFGLWSFKMLFSDPKALIRLVRNLTKKSDVIEDDENYAELFSIAVKSNQQKKGIGKILLKETEKELKIKGVENLSLTTDYYDNDATIAFYKSMGYNILYDFITYPQRRMYRFIKHL